jgi:hypothetical protein
LSATAEFLQHVLPLSGPYCIVVKKPDGAHWHFAAEDIDEASAIAAEQDRENENVFFAVGALLQAKHWDTSKGEDHGYWRVVRKAENIRALRSYTMDMDAGNGRAYNTTDDAIRDLVRFCRHYRLPKPTVVQSGFGLHIYWTLTDEVPKAEWRERGRQLSAMAKALDVKHDSARSVDAASILRVVGTHNYKYPEKPEVIVLNLGVDTPTTSFHATLDLNNNAAPAPHLNGHAGPPVFFGNNTNRFEPECLDPRLLVQNCAAFRRTVDPDNQKLGRDAIPEPAWMCAMMLAVHCKSGRKVAHSISDKDPRYSAAYVDAQYDRWEKQGMGPTTCAKYKAAWEDHDGSNVCDGCPSEGKITSPAVVARYFKLIPPLVIQDVNDEGVVIERKIVPPPDPYIRTDRGIGIRTADNRTGANITEIFCPYDMYPVRMQYDERTMIEDSVGWKVNLPHVGWTNLDIPHTGKIQLSLMLQKRGIYVDEHRTHMMASFMTNYVRKLQNEVPREMAYVKMGWRKNGFIVGDTLYTKDGLTENHRMSHTLEEATQNGMVTEGDPALWQRAAQLYNRDGLQAYRAFLYSGLGSPLYCMTGQVAACVNASGRGGIGKSTVLDVVAAIWGNPRAIVMRDTTRAAAEINCNAMHNLPCMLDEITNRTAKDISAFIFGYGGGKGRLRSQSGGGIRADLATWSNLGLTNSNTDVYATMASVSRESDPQAARLVQLEFPDITTVTKAEGDMVRQLVNANYGHAGRDFAAYIAQHESEIRRRVLKYNAEADRAVDAKSEERFWTAWVAVCRCAAEIGYDLGLFAGFPITDDINWLYEQINVIRYRIREHNAIPAETIASFLDEHQSNTLVLSAKNAGNIDNVASEPRIELLIRKELDTGIAFISRNALQDYCAEHSINLTRMLRDLYDLRIVLQDNTRKVLGMGTKWAAGQVRCVEIDLSKLDAP